jgi:hypothetical protein
MTVRKLALAYGFSDSVSAYRSVDRDRIPIQLISYFPHQLPSVSFFWLCRWIRNNIDSKPSSAY